jgi:hypothetical protein
MTFRWSSSDIVLSATWLKTSLLLVGAVVAGELPTLAVGMHVLIGNVNPRHIISFAEELV